MNLFSRFPWPVASDCASDWANDCASTSRKPSSAGFKAWSSAALGGLIAGLLSLAPLGPSALAQEAAGPGCPPAAVTPSPAEVQAGMLAAKDRGPLWKVEKDGLTHYLYGTVHVARMEWMYPGPTVRQALIRSQALGLEMDLLDAASMKRLGELMRATPDSATLPTDLTERLRQAAQRACLGDTLAALLPEMQVATLAATSLRHEGLDPAYGIDGFLAGLGHGLGKPVLAMETPERQAQVLLAKNAAERESMVRDGLREVEDPKALDILRRLVRLWEQADAQALERYGEWCDCLETAEDRERMRQMIDERNGPMADQLVAAHQRGQTLFLAVGALHMSGPQSLVRLLKARGFNVSQVAYPAAAGSDQGSRKP